MRQTVSVLMPTLNSAKTVSAALDALVQCDEVKEVLVADGGSLDRTISIVSVVSR